MSAYYNENDPKAAAWLRELIKAGAIAAGDVDERDIRDISPSDLKGFTQHHFFAGIGGWSYALRLADWDDTEPVWTGSCPCQPFSAAGRGGGFADERHLWPSWFHLIQQCRPAVIFGEQVASPDGLGWLDLIQTDLEATNHTFGAADLCAAGVGAPHIRQRLYFVARADRDGCEGSRLHIPKWQPREALSVSWRSGQTRHMAHSYSRERHGQSSGEECQRNGSPTGWDESNSELERGDATGQLDHTGSTGSRRDSRTIPTAKSGSERSLRSQPHQLEPPGTASQPKKPSCFWSHCDWLYCRDEKHRPVEPGSFPLAHGLPARVGRLRGYGNAIVAQQAAAFIQAYRQC